IFSSIKKYSCSAPTTLRTERLFIPARPSKRTACLFNALQLRSSGGFLSNASPLADLNVEGTNKHPSLIKGVEEKSHDVMPLASKVCRIPPVGKLEASPSPCNSSFVRNFAKAFPL